MENKLKSEHSKYLVRHASNPIAWQTYNKETLQLAKSQNKPIFLSSGYSACHYCNLMEQQSFENDEVAKIINDNFIPILIDKDEYPDIDKEYQFYLQSTGEAGGWPLNVFLTPDMQPFFAGTYFPLANSADKPSFKDLISGLADIYNNKRDEIDKVIEVRNEFLKSFKQVLDNPLVAEDKIIEYATQEFRKIFDNEFGGFRDGAKFPYVPALLLLTDIEDDEVLSFLCKTADSICSLGISDHLFGGFFRYTTDRKWLEPHFEKMLVDNALIPKFLIKMYNITGNGLYLLTAKKAIDFVINNLMTDYGILNSVESDTKNADGELSEGYYYKVTDRDFTVLSEGELKNFPQDAGVQSGVIYLKNAEYIKAVALQPTLEKVANRIAGVRLAPELDNKVVAGANFLFCTTLLECFETSGDDWFLNQATALYHKISYVLTDNGIVYRCSYGENIIHHATLEDHIYYLEATLTFYEITKEREFQIVAKQILKAINDNFIANGLLYLDSDKKISDTFDDDKPNAIGMYYYLLTKYDYAVDTKISDELKAFVLDRVNRFPTGHATMIRAFV